jgi:hypothetical protein
MQSTSALTLVYLNAQVQRDVTCPKRAVRSNVSGAIYRDLHAPITATSACGHRMPILFNTRHYDRKAVGLAGTYIPPGESTGRQMTVVNLSVTGVHLRTPLPHMLHVDDIIDLAFGLEDGRHTEIREDIAIRLVHTDETFGAEFVEPECDEALHFYLTPWTVQI